MKAIDCAASAVFLLATLSFGTWIASADEKVVPAPENRPPSAENPTAPAEKFATPPSPAAKAAQKLTFVARAMSLKSVLNKMQHHYDTTKSFSARFKEEIAAVGAPKKTRQGIVYFEKPGRMRWEFQAPDAQSIVSDGKQVYSYDPELNQVVESPLKDAVRSSGAAGFLLGFGNIARDFDASVPKKPPSDGHVHVILKPKGASERFEVALDPSSYDIVGFAMTDQLGNVTRLDFDDVRDNAVTDDSLFAFSVPPGADVVTAPQSP